MIRGFMKTTSRTALLAAAGMLIGSYAYTPAKAADLKGGDCCADLEERVAELEATTARKGNRVVSLTIYGQVSRGLLIWDDGDDSDAYVVENDAAATRFGFKGEGQMKPGWKAGFNIELEVQDAASDEVSQGFDEVTNALENADEDRGIAETVRTRLAYWYINSERLGQVSLGHLATASDGITEITLQNNAGKAMGTTAFVKSFSTEPRSSLLYDDSPTWGDVAANLAGNGRNDIIRYDSPSLHGFILSTSWGDDDIADVALRYKGEWNSLRVAAGVAWAYDGTGTNAGESSSEFEIIGGSVSVMHIPTGIFVSAAAAEKEYEVVLDSASYWAVQAGIERKWLPYGATTITAEYASYEGDFNGSSGLTFSGASNGNFNDWEANKWGLSIVQTFDSAALDIFAHFEHWEGDGTVTAGADDFASDDELSVIMLGSRIRF
jgi:predicted porin